MLRFEELFEEAVEVIEVCRHLSYENSWHRFYN